MRFFVNEKNTDYSLTITCEGALIFFWKQNNFFHLLLKTFCLLIWSKYGSSQDRGYLLTMFEEKKIGVTFGTNYQWKQTISFTLFLKKINKNQANMKMMPTNMNGQSYVHNVI